jgi:hypothetical protein
VSPKQSRAAAAAAAILAAVAAPVAGAAAHPAAAGKTIHVIEHAVTDTVVYSGGQGKKDVNGNTLTFHNPIYDAKNKRVVGHDQGWCMRIDPNAGSWECFWTAFLHGGQITVEGPYYDTHNSTLAITGGTGAYRGARGQMRLLSRAKGTQYDFIYRLL